MYQCVHIHIHKFVKYIGFGHEVNYIHLYVFLAVLVRKFLSYHSPKSAVSFQYSAAVFDSNVAALCTYYVLTDYGIAMFQFRLRTCKTKRDTQQQTLKPRIG